MYIYGGQLECGLCHFELNQAEGAGGAVNIQAGVAVLNGSIFTSNSAASGGAVCMGDMASTFPMLVQTSYVNNSAKFGGALYLQIPPPLLTWEGVCSLLTVLRASNNHASQAGGFAFFAGNTSQPPSCILRFAKIAEHFGTASFYGNVFATSPARISVLSVQDNPYLSNEVIKIHPSQSISLVASVHDAFEQPCVQDPPIGINLSPSSTIEFVGSLVGRLNGSGIASFTQASAIQVLQGSANQKFNLSVNTGSTGVQSSTVQMAVVSCGAG